MAGADIAIAARRLGKSFAIYSHPKDLLLELITGRPRHASFEALCDVSFEIRRGEVVGVMGRNGAGKSTLLKLIAGTLEPTSGRVEVAGRVAAILELGTGFHDQYTGRENVLMGGLCLGMSEREVRSKLDAIIEFSELEEFIDQPFRTYSTGMQARLAFATAIAVDPEILIVDEALAVGDAKFQLKCYDRFRDMRRGGCTILVVSHSSEQVTRLCDRAILLERGRLVEDGTAIEVTRLYHQRLFGGQGTTGPPAGDGAPAAHAAEGAAGPNTQPDTPGHTAGVARGADSDAAATAAPAAEGAARGTRMGTGQVRIELVQILDGEGRDVRRLMPGASYRVRFEAVAAERLEGLVAGFLVRDPTGQTIHGLDTALERDLRFDAEAGERFAVCMRFACHLGPGDYFLSYGVARHDGLKLDYRYDAAPFFVERRPGVYHASRADLDAEITVERSAGGAPPSLAAAEAPASASSPGAPWA